MHKTLSHFWYSQPLRYLFIGGMSFIIELSVLISVSELFSLSPTVAVAISFWIGLIASFVLQKYITFSSKDSDKKTLSKQTILYGMLVLFNYAFTIVFVGWTAGFIGLVTARAFALLATVSWNYLIYKRIFK